MPHPPQRILGLLPAKHIQTTTTKIDNKPPGIRLMRLQAHTQDGILVQELHNVLAVINVS